MRPGFVLLLVLLSAPLALALDVPAPIGFLNDHAGLLTPEERAGLESVLRGIEENGTVEVAVLIIPSLEDEDLEGYATRVFREWGVGKEDIDNGALILIVADERKVRIETGYGLEGAVTDIAAGFIIRGSIAPAFQQERYADGIEAAALDISDLASGDGATRSQQGAGGGAQNAAWLLAVPALMALYGLIALYAFARYRHDVRKRRATRGWGSAVVFALAWIVSAATSWLVLLLVIFFLIMVNTAGNGGGWLFPPMGGTGGGWGGSGGFGGFGGGMSGGGGASGGW